MKRTTIFMATLLASTAAVATPIIFSEATSFVPEGPPIAPYYYQPEYSNETLIGVAPSDNRRYNVAYSRWYGLYEYEPGRMSRFTDRAVGRSDIYADNSFSLLTHGLNNGTATETLRYSDTIKTADGTQRLFLDLKLLDSYISMTGRDSGAGNVYRDIALHVNGNRVAHEHIELTLSNGEVTCERNGEGVLASHSSCASRTTSPVDEGIRLKEGLEYFTVFAGANTYAVDLGEWGPNEELNIEYTYSLGSQLTRGIDCKPISTRYEADGDSYSITESNCAYAVNEVADPVGYRSIPAFNLAASTSSAAVPEPTTFWLAALGGAALLRRRRK